MAWDSNVSRLVDALFVASVVRHMVQYRDNVSSTFLCFLFFQFSGHLLRSMKEYEMMTKNDLLVHPLVAHLQSCNSHTDILAFLRTQFQQFEQPMSGDKLTKW